MLHNFVNVIISIKNFVFKINTPTQFRFKIFQKSQFERKEICQLLLSTWLSFKQKNKDIQIKIV